VFLLMVFDDSFDDTGQVAMRLDFVQLTGLDERREHGPVLGTCNKRSGMWGLSCAYRSCGTNSAALSSHQRPRAMHARSPRLHLRKC
jgi:hypothetical protein